MKKFNTRFKVCSFVWEKLYNSFISSNIAKIEENFKKEWHWFGYIIILNLTCITTVNLNKSHHWLNNISQDRIQDWCLLLILCKYLVQSIFYIESVSFILYSWLQTLCSFQLTFTFEKCGKFSLIFVFLENLRIRSI